MTEDEEVLDISHYKRIKKLGSGKFGKVYEIANDRGETFAAKVSLTSYKKSTRSALRDLQREVNIISQLNHPAVLKFIGFSPVDFKNRLRPTIITELLVNGSLSDLILSERNGFSQSNWDDTRKLIVIYGIANAMEYLHSNKIIHRDLKPDNIMMDEFMYPKIVDFGMSKSLNSTTNSTVNFKGTPIFMAPEIFEKAQYDEAVDVYAYAIIVYEVMTNQELTIDNRKSLDFMMVRKLVLDGLRPKFNDVPIGEAYKELIEKCWEQNPSERPSFSEIVQVLRENHDFITEQVDENAFFDYVEYIDQFKTSFYKDKIITKIDDFMKTKNNILTRVEVKKHKIIEEDDGDGDEAQENKNSQLYPKEQFNTLSEQCKQMVIEADENAELQFNVGKCHIEGLQNFPQNTEIGIKYLKKAAKAGCVDSAIYYSKLLIKGDIIPSDVEKAKKYLEPHIDSKNPATFLLLGKVYKKEENYEKAKELLLKSSKSGNGEAQYEYGKLLYQGKGVKKNEKEALKFFEMAKKNGYNKSDKFLAKHQNQEQKTNQTKDINQSNNYNEQHNEKPNKKADIYKFFIEQQQQQQQQQQIQPQQLDLNNPQSCKIAAEKGDPEAMNKLGIMLMKGVGFEKNPQLACQYFKLAADKGHTDAMNNYGRMLEEGVSVKQNYALAAAYYKKAAESGHFGAMDNYAYMLNNGLGVEVNKNEAIRYYRIAAKNGIKTAINDLGPLLLNDGPRTTDNYQEALYYLNIGAKDGCTNSMNCLGYMLENGFGVVQVELPKAAALYKMAADKGHEQAMYNYALMLNIGKGIPQNIGESYKYFHMAADNGIVSAMSRLGQIYSDQGNNIQAAKYIKMAADNGVVDDIYRYGTFLEKGIGVQQNVPEAVKYYRDAAMKGYHFAQFSYAFCLQNGIAIQMNKFEAEKFYRLAYNQGNISAAFYLGMMLKNGDGIPIDFNEAAILLKFAADGGMPEAMFHYALMLDQNIQTKMEAFKYFKMAVDNGYNEAMPYYQQGLLLFGFLSMM